MNPDDPAWGSYTFAYVLLVGGLVLTVSALVVGVIPALITVRSSS